MIPEFKALVVSEEKDTYVSDVKMRSIDELPEGDVLIKVHYSSLNYKDALSANGNKGVTKNYPHTPGIDAAGIVVYSTTDAFVVGESVIVTSYDFGMNHAGGFAEYIRVPAEWVVKLPQNLTLREAMLYGTAGLTAGVGVSKIVALVAPEDGPVVVSGATGGVGSISVMILSKLGYTVTALTGKPDEAGFLKSLGASNVIARSEFEMKESRPMLKGLYAGAIDTVGGVILDNIIKSLKPFGGVACCGNAAAADLDLTVYPFILRGISLMGLSSQNYPMHKRLKVWEQLAGEYKPTQLSDLCTEISLEELPERIAAMTAGSVKGRTIIRMN
ncbi:MAG: YhdH/YhfP family quinone oxidoreductase [Reichenbachiella sp.]